jgi:hypothetical protein
MVPTRARRRKSDGSCGGRNGYSSSAWGAYGDGGAPHCPTLRAPERVGSLLALGLITGAETSSSQVMTHDKIGLFFARRVEAWAHRDVAALVKDYAEDCVVESRVQAY